MMTIPFTLQTQVKPLRLFLFAAIVLSFILTLAALYLSPSASRFAAIAPYLIYALLIISAYSVLSDSQSQTFSMTPAFRHGLLWGLLLTTLIFILFPPQFRVLGDEFELLSNSRAIYEHFSLNTLHQFIQDSRTLKIDYEIDYAAHRPGLFAALLALLHFILGFDPENVFILNFAVSTLSLALLYWVGYKHSQTAAILLPLLMALYPIYQLDVTSGGFDALNMLMLSIAYLQLYRFLNDTRQLPLLILAALLASSCRYESALVFLAVLIAVLHKRQAIYAQLHHYSPLLYATPLLFLPVVWQKLVSSNLVNAGSSESAFAFNRIADNLLANFDFFFGFNITTPSSYLTGILAVLYVALYLPSQLNKRLRLLIGLVVLTHLLLALIHMSYQYGDYRQPWINRFAHVHLLILIPLAGLALTHLYRKNKAVVLIVLGVMTAQNLYITRHSLIHVMPWSTEVKQISQFLKKYDYRRDNTLIISHAAFTYTALGYSSIGGYFSVKGFYLNDDFTGFDLNAAYQQQHFEHILVIDRQSSRSAQVADTIKNLYPQYRLSELERFYLIQDEWVTVSELHPDITRPSGNVTTYEASL